MNRIQLSPLATLTQTKEHSQQEGSQLTPAAAQIARSLRGLGAETAGSGIRLSAGCLDALQRR